jgi:hypothetical protein
MHRSAWKGNSAKLNFRFTEFSEVHGPSRVAFFLSLSLGTDLGCILLRTGRLWQVFGEPGGEGQNVRGGQVGPVAVDQHVADHGWAHLPGAVPDAQHPMPQLTTRQRCLTAVDDPAHRVSERATFINFAVEPRYCFTSYQEAAGTRCSTRKFTGSAPKWRRIPSQRSSNTAWASPSADSSTSPSTSLTRNTERVDSLSSPL